MRAVDRRCVRVGDDLAERLAETLMAFDREVLVEEEHDEMFVHEIADGAGDALVDVHAAHVTCCRHAAAAQQRCDRQDAKASPSTMSPLASHS